MISPPTSPGPSAFARTRLYTERRAARRHSLEICMVLPRSGELHFCRMRDLSSSGAFIETDQPFVVGERLSLAVASNRLGLPLEGVVSRRVAPRLGRPGVGVRFIREGARCPQTQDDLILYLLNYPHHLQWDAR
jgi:hypothetical protein